MDQSDALDIVRILYQRKTREVVGEVDYVFQAVTGIRLITRQCGKELLMLTLVHSVKPLAKIVQRVQTDVAVHKHGQLRRLDLNNRSHRCEMLRIHSDLAEFFRQLRFRTREFDFRTVRRMLN